MAEDPQLIAVRLLHSELLRANVRGARVTPAPGGGVEVLLRAFPVIEAPGPAPGQDPRAWAQATTRLVLERVAPWKAP
jgi:hypothetical protein